ncbi:hypothetical protein CHARACLAT_003991 [Characodon lateralis]|uniref:Uncharacterized protein n=1 Tax=Characodon lateralis TaxID=208331 RepID=A0ABU7DXJ7_9TELE|nr:hypothetical protein [Characodon lateralis]
MCVRAESGRGELNLKQPSLAQASVYRVTVQLALWGDTDRLTQAYTHSHESLWPVCLIKPTILCRAIGTVRQQSATPSLPRCSRIPLLCELKTPTTSSGFHSLWGMYIYFFCSDRNSLCSPNSTSDCARVDD